MKITFHKVVNSLPTAPVADGLYVVKVAGTTDFNLFVTDASGIPHKLPDGYIPPLTDGNPRIAQALSGFGWLWGGWTPVHTANTGLLDRGWVLAHRMTAPQMTTGLVGGQMDLLLNGHFGRQIVYARECRARVIFGWRVKVNGTVVATRDLTDNYYERRTNLGNETILEYDQKHGQISWNYVRNNVPFGASIEIEYRCRYQISGVQTNAYGRIIAGYGRELSALFVPRKSIMSI